MESAISRTFERPYRTLGARLFNGIGRRLRRWGWRRRLSMDDILAAARRRTGLTDWGDERFLEPMRVLLASLEDEARLNPLGRLFMRLNLRHFVGNRLLVRQYLKDHPEALDKPVTRPLFVVGLPRTGTTLLHNLLCQDPTRRAPLFWELLQPAPAPGRRDRRPPVARRLVHFLDRWGAPQLRTVHTLHADGPEECTCLLFNTFVNPAFFLFGDVSGYIDWLRGRGRELLPWAYEEYRTYLQVLQCQGRRAAWVLKSPVHAFALDALLQVFPDACVVQTHRDMNEVLPSACSLFAIMQGLYSDDVDARRLGPAVAESLRMHLDSYTERARDLDSTRVLDVAYRALLADPTGTVRGIYRHFNLDESEAMEQGMRRWLAENPANKHGVHRYDLEQFGLSRQQVERLFGPYQEQFIKPAAGAWV
jgi:hypothetical protein